MDENENTAAGYYVGTEFCGNTEPHEEHGHTVAKSPLPGVNLTYLANCPGVEE